MRKILLALTVVSALAFNVPGAQAHLGSHEFHSGTATPCAVMCSYWDVPTRLGFTPCEFPFPDGSYIDIITEAAPALSGGKTHEVLSTEIDPTLDWDHWICALGTGSHTDGSQKELAQGANNVGDNCDNALGANNPVEEGCIERASTPATPGTKYVIRLYNWIDVFETTGKYTWIQL